MKKPIVSLSLALLMTLSSALRAAHTCCASAALTSGTVSPHSLYQLDAPWTDDRDQTVTLGNFGGRPVVIAMFFASCTYACPIIVDDLQRLRDSLPAEIRDRAQFVLVSFDTERDTPDVLQAYRERMKLTDEHWTLLRGDPESVQELAMLLGVKFRRNVTGDYAHSNVITILNEAGEIVHQRSGLQGEVATAAKALSLVSR